ncbi:hypothetical protein [Parasulfitobacter algicola]|uniref:5-bromo-4-chloroindolyl phosphate hydrolysis protein n=1 Tax=Parasulfitobacter algicola TaxID=2614809 RepID=A0ABX2ITP9_9RHOB|nr:hypothetical protein [Sulfitobacter algicola]NSX55700.1 hypothetical protein [Sulfitobacter algicola]
MDMITGGGIVIAALSILFFIWLRPKQKLGWQGKAGLILSTYGERLRGAAEQIDQPYADIFWDMAERLERVRTEVMEDKRDLAMTRRFIYHHARLIVDLVEKFVKLNDKVRPEQQDRLDAMGAQMQEYRELFGRVEKACIDNDFADMEATMAALDTQLARLTF